jgi:hypothetical protein
MLMVQIHKVIKDLEAIQTSSSKLKFELNEEWCYLNPCFALISTKSY